MNSREISAPSSQGNSGSAPDKSYFVPPPTVSLPKGGGAIKGMGEKFAANPVTGTGSMSIPIVTSQGRSGFSPQLSLSYDSGAGNGIFGMGWNLSLPAITRKTDKGLPRYWDSEESDVFILSGAEDLVPVLKADGSREIVDSLDGQFKIQRYRPRIEGLFARIERWTKVDSGEIHWRSISKDNISTLYGKTENSRIADPENLTHVFSWLICESYDDKGNAIYYSYRSEDNSNGIDLAQANERNRTPKSRSSNRYLKHIYYGNLKPRQANEDLSKRKDWLFEVVFDYGEHDRLKPIPQEPTAWTTATLRNDPFSSFRSGFEVRTYRLCQRVLMFHHFSDEPEVRKDCLVRSTDFTYSYEQNLKDTQKPIYSFLKSVQQTGYKRNGDSYTQKSLPPLDFTYSEPIIDERLWDVDRKSLENLPQGLDGTRYQWVDLHGEGLSGILTEQGGGWFYKRNLSPINPMQADKTRVEAQFAAVGVVATKPASGLANGSQFMDLAGDGQLDVVTLRGATPGFYERTQDKGWESFVAFKSLPNLDWDNPNLKFIDLDGDGHSDILITEDDCFVWYPSLAEDGFEAAERVYQPWDEEKGARVIFADSTQSIHLADMSGDGLTDIVRICNSGVCYWPNLGYGRFGAKVAMDNAPLFDCLGIFNQRRIVLADIDGSGTTDILYLSGEGVQVYFNQSGNSWSKKRVLRSFPAIDNVVSVTTLDLLGNGTACLVWSSPGHGQRVMRYIDLMGGQKPHLLVKTVNNMGAETVVQYAPSTRFYLEDEQKGQPWITKLPFLVHVVERVETYDRISGNRFVTRYAYHHGYFDGVEREFRGFGMVEQWDTEEIGTVQSGDTASVGTNLDVASFVPPVLTKTWFHTGVYFAREKISRLFEHEYYRAPGLSDAEFQALLLLDTTLPAGLTVEEEREACRALKGMMLRQEVYADDAPSGSSAAITQRARTPYTVVEQDFAIRRLQPLTDKHHGVFFTHPREVITYHYERNSSDPRIQHALTLEVDEFGNGLKSVAIAYPRRKSEFPEQGKTFVTYTENRVANIPNEKPNDPDWYRIGVPIETLTYEVTGLPIAFPYKLEALRTDLARATEIAYETVAVGEQLRKRPIEWVRVLYRPNAQATTLDPTPLLLGEVESLALPYESFKLAFTSGLLEQIYGVNNGSKITAAELNNLLGGEGKYVKQNLRDDVVGWWIPSGRQAFDPDGFYVSPQMKDLFGGIYSMTYDLYRLFVVETSDALPDGQKNVVQVRNDYRVMQPWQITDPNGNQVEAVFDALGMVAGTAVMSKATDVPRFGDRLTTDFRADLTQAEIDAFLANPLTMAASLLGEATTRIIYDLEQFRTDGQPLVAATIAREVHVSNLPAGTQSKVQVSFSYSDGFGREVQKKSQAERGDAPEREANTAKPNRPGKLVLENGKTKLLPTDPRWVGNGRTIFNNKGKPVKQYEPFFSSTHLYEDEPEMVMTGVTPILFYDPLERVVATLHPNHTYEKVVFDPWQQVTWDVNDTVVQTEPNTIANDPKTDPHVGEFFRRLPDRDYLPTWYSRFSTSAIASEKDAAQKALAHAGTSAIAHLDTLGRTFLTIADNGVAGKYETRVELDLEGNQLVITDARKNAVMIYAIVQKDADGKPVKNAQGKPILMGRAFDLLGHNLYSYSMDAGDRWMLNNVAGKPIRMWDSRNHILRTTYDALQRPTQLFVKTGNDPEFMAEKTVYGEGKGDATNHRGRIYQHFDSAGVATNGAFDFKGNLLSSTRQLVQDYKTIPDWAIDPALEAEFFSSSTRYDALNRPIQLVAPHSNQPSTKLNVIRPGYNEANLLERMDVWLGEATEPRLLLDPQSANFHAVTNIDHDAKGQRTLIEYGNGAKTAYTYDENTFRLIHLKTTRGGAVLQDLFYTYDPVGNITRIRDDAQQTIYFNNQVVPPHCDYRYDPIYRLIEAMGREHIGQAGQPQETKWDDEFRVNLPHPSDGQAMRNYTEQYVYDAVGNFERLIHQATNGNWTRAYAYNEASLIEPGKLSNRLSSTTVGQRTEPYSYDAHGNMTSMPHLTLMQWDYKDELRATSRQAVNDTPPPNTVPETTFYVYDASGERVRKVTERQNGTRKNERIYLGGFELYREFKSNGNDVKLERETLHGMDDKQRIALVETKTITNPDDESPTQLIRFQLSNHLGSACLELDDKANVISYEEYTPYGSTSYQAVDKSIKATAKRYRYTGKERDEETGLYYHGARYYAPWLGRWVSFDPIILEDSTRAQRSEASSLSQIPQNYLFSYQNPIRFLDPDGFSPVDKVGKRVAQEFVSEIGRKEAQYAARQVARKSEGFIKRGGSALKQALEHIAEHFKPNPDKASHAIFLSKYRNQSAVSDLIRQGVANPSGSPILSRATSESGQAVGKYVFIIEREFAEDIGEIESKKLVQEGGKEVSKTVKEPTKILRTVVDITGKVITAYPVKEFTKRLAVAGITASAAASAFAIVQSVFEGEAKAYQEQVEKTTKKNEEEHPLVTALTFIPWIGSIFETSSSSHEAVYEQANQRAEQALNQLQSRLQKEGVKLSEEEAQAFKQNIRNIWTGSDSEK